jgi:DNA polymerase III alpha subunit
MERLDYLYGEDRQITFNKFDIHLLSYEEIKSAMESQGIDRPDIYENTLKLAETVEDYDIKDGLNLLPVQYKNPDQELANLAFAALEEKRLNSNWINNDIYDQRLDEELSIIRDKKICTILFGSSKHDFLGKKRKYYGWSRTWIICWFISLLSTWHYRY